MSSKKATPAEIHEAMEEQKRLKELQTRLNGLMNKVKETINSITVRSESFSKTICCSLRLTFLGRKYPADKLPDR